MVAYRLNVIDKGIDHYRDQDVWGRQEPSRSADGAFAARSRESDRKSSPKPLNSKNGVR